MPKVNCNSVRDSFLKHLTEVSTIQLVRDLCVLTVPMRTVDGRLVDVFIESRAEDYFLVHDAGKAANELILQGVNLTPSIQKNCESLATKFSVQWSEEMFQVRCKIDHLNAAILGVAMCSSLATIHLLEHIQGRPC